MGGGLVGGHGSAAETAFVRESNLAGAVLALNVPSSGVHMGGGQRRLFFLVVFLCGSSLTSVLGGGRWQHRFRFLGVKLWWVSGGGVLVWRTWVVFHIVTHAC